MKRQNYSEDITIRERNLLGLRIHSFNLEELICLLKTKMDSEMPLIVYGFSANIYSRIRKLPEFVYFFQKMDIIIPDGQGIPVLARLFNIDIKERVGIVNLANRLLQVANSNNYKIYLLGATEGINKTACSNILKEYKGIKNCIGRSGYFSIDEKTKIVNEIGEYKPDILFIGISSPLKERFALEFKYELNARLIIPCGGWIDTISGKIKRPPYIFKRLPVTWLFRFFQEPRRLFKPVILTVLDTCCVILPILYLKHLFGFERNPSIVKHLKLEEELAKCSKL